MRTVYNQRAKLLYENYRRAELEVVLSDVINKLMPNAPSYIEKVHCKRCSFSKQFESSIIRIRDLKSMLNLDEVIKKNAPDEQHCECGEKLRVQREPGTHLFIEVILLGLDFINA